MSKRTEQIATRVDEPTKKRFRVAAAERDMDMSELLREIVDDFLDAETPDEGNPNPAEASS